ncbi:putative virulence protein [Legionella steigerwaltii]|uniref:Virulence protein n=1 Tax=Legionella steigerwaltii TaxID=460 RepID=A0A378L6Q9_9GAMM|nr:YdgA family protein [Legionella steigerwaltii]KTD80332.1 putative virulence protein [Legionella steigerwaltii]STY22414.1 putative virulence protein [Legionella steigerwaltii]
MKKWTGFLVFLVVLILVAYYALGFTIKSTLNKNINSIPKSSAFNIRLQKYHNGWFSSQAILSVKMHIPAQTTTDKSGVTKTEPPVDFDIDIPILIKHGPFIFTNYGIRFGMGVITTQPETHYEAFINYLNKTIFRYTLPSFAIEGKIGQNQGDFQLTWEGLASLLSVSSNLDLMEGNLQLLGLNGAANNPANPQSNVTFKIGKITYDFKMKRYQEWLWLGHSRFDIPSIAINLAGNQLFELTEFDFLARSGVDHEALNIDFKLSLQKLFANNQNYGPGVIHLSFRNLDPAAAAKINEQESNIMQNNSDPNMIGLAFANGLPQLLSKGAVVELSELTLNIPDGKIEGNFKIALPKNENSDLSQVMQKLQGEGSFKAPIVTVKTLLVASFKNDSSNDNTQSNPVTSPTPTTSATQILTNPDNDPDKKADKILQDLVSKGFLKIEGNDYVFTFKLENQKIMVNGQVFNPDMLK